MDFDALATEQRYQLLVNAVSDYAIYMLAPDGVVLTWNPGAQRFKGYEPDEIIGQNFARFFTEADRAAGKPAQILGIAAAEGRFEEEGRRVRKDGTEIWVHVVIDPIRGEDGTLLGFAKITRDVTERRAAQRALYESEQRFRMLVQGVRDYAIYMLDADGIVTNWNAGAEAIKGYQQDEIVGQHFSRFYTEEDRLRGEPALALATARAEGKYEREAERLRKDGSRFWASVVIDPIYDETGTLVGFAKITRDITEKRRIADELEEARTQLFQSQKLQALGQLTGGIAHDFNNLMTVVRGSAELLQKAELSDEKRLRYANAIVDTADRATALTAKLLAFGRRQALRPEILDLNLRLDAIAEVLARTIGSHIRLTLDIAPDVRPIEADAAELETAIVNAAFNARDAMPGGGEIVIAARNEDEDVRIEIRDNGEGIAPELLEHVFEPFFTTKPVGKGTGLGLSQIHGFAAQTGGHAEVASVQGEGTIVSLILPWTDRAPTAPSEEVASAVNWTGLVVLLVEDNANVRQFATTMLRELGAVVTPAASVEQADAMLARDNYDVVFSDIVMPGESGLDLARRLRVDKPDLPVLLATGYSREVTNGEAAGFAILQKPYGAESLAKAIGRVLGNRCQNNADTLQERI
ncbi:hybrid sensor histidine kinase/response regulator [Sphingomonas crocodyli]|uniref:histidine kinase n=1 Tax=Sphingomonas crocodyli TaxID=1979270 RepID=A0A437LWH8_9SPHN|nr:PAS domain-containing sensor histidine kinase [Sphingomonas crocodyli]RVT89726.1 PAS domain-containing sensor histidine kinase [Sphingomonas crocodyli]